MHVARQGLDDMAPALEAAFNASRDDDRLDRVFGPHPRATIAAIIVGGLIAGALLERLPVLEALSEHIDLAAVLIGAAWALMIRHYLFGSGEARRSDFAWLAASLVPAGAALVAVEFLSLLAFDGVGPVPGGPTWTVVGSALDALADALALGAGLTIAVAALCFARDWRKVFKDLALQLVIFKLGVAIMVLLIVEIGIIGPILGVIVEGLLGIDIPDWLGEFVDRLTYALLMTTIYLAVIGATWTVCRRTFGELLRTGDAEILRAVREMGKPPEKRAPEPEAAADGGGSNEIGPKGGNSAPD